MLLALKEGVCTTAGHPQVLLISNETVGLEKICQMAVTSA